MLSLCLLFCFVSTLEQKTLFFRNVHVSCHCHFPATPYFSLSHYLLNTCEFQLLQQILPFSEHPGVLQYVPWEEWSDLAQGILRHQWHKTNTEPQLALALLYFWFLHPYGCLLGHQTVTAMTGIIICQPHDRWSLLLFFRITSLNAI